jgi:hypothetical protein
MAIPNVFAISTIFIFNGAGNAVSQEHIPMYSMKECHAYARQVLGNDVTEKNDTFITTVSASVGSSGGGSGYTGRMTREIVCAKTRS